MNLRIFPNLSELNENLAKYVINIAADHIKTHGHFNFVLTGGSSPKALYKSLSTTYKGEIDWSRVYFFMGDERNVPATDKDYNGMMAKETLLQPLEIADDHYFLVDTSLAPADAAKAYQDQISAHFGNEPLIFDLILLGIGDDAHTASIFPGTELVDNIAKGIAAVWVEKLNTYRISFTAPLISSARNIAFIAYGENKSEALFHVLADADKDYSRYPAQLIHQKDGKLDWFVDEHAARLLEI